MGQCQQRSRSRYRSFQKSQDVSSAGTCVPQCSSKLLGIEDWRRTGIADVRVSMKGNGNCKPSSTEELRDGLDGRAIGLLEW